MIWQTNMSLARHSRLIGELVVSDMVFVNQGKENDAQTIQIAEAEMVLRIEEQLYGHLWEQMLQVWDAHDAFAKSNKATDNDRLVEMLTKLSSMMGLAHE